MYRRQSLNTETSSINSKYLEIYLDSSSSTKHNIDNLKKKV